MDQDLLINKLTTLERRLKLLLNEHNSLKQEVDHLKNENKELKSVIKSKEDQLEQYKNKINIHNIVNSTTVDDVESTELKQKLSDYIKKIDMCIAHLSE